MSVNRGGGLREPGTVKGGARIWEAHPVLVQQQGTRAEQLHGGVNDARIPLFFDFESVWGFTILNGVSNVLRQRLVLAN